MTLFLQYLRPYGFCAYNSLMNLMMVVALVPALRLLFLTDIIESQWTYRSSNLELKISSRYRLLQDGLLPYAIDAECHIQSFPCLTISSIISIRTFCTNVISICSLSSSFLVALNSLSVRQLVTLKIIIT